jgi:DNA topoisomerase-2
LRIIAGLTSVPLFLRLTFGPSVVDVAGCNSRLNVYLNGTKIDMKSFKDYVALYFKSREESNRPEILGPEVISDKDGKKRWEVAFCVSGGEFAQVSFVNSIWTIRGGNHVTAIVKKITDTLGPKVSRAFLESKKKRSCSSM